MGKIQKKVSMTLIGFMVSLLVSLGGISMVPMVGMETTYASEISETYLNKQSVSVTVGKSVKLKVYNAEGKVKWSSSKPGVASVSKNGKVKAVKKGTTTIRAKVKGVTYSCKVKVEKPAISITSATISIGEEVTVKIKGTNRSIKWSSGNPKIATVENGVITGVKFGTTTITAKVGGERYTCKVTVISKQKQYARQLEALINQERSKYGVPAMNYDTELRRAAQIRAEELYRNYSDTRPNGTSCFSTIRTSVYKWSVAAEVTARRYVTPRAVIDAWAGNSDNLAVLLNTGYKDMGVGVYLAPDGYLYWCVMEASR